MPDFIQWHEADRNALPYLSASARIDRDAAFNTAWLTRLAGLDLNALDQQGRIDVLLLRNQLRLRTVRGERQRKRFKETEPLLPFRTAIEELEAKRWRMVSLDPIVAADAVAAVPEQIKKTREALTRGKSDKPIEKPAVAHPDEKPADEKKEEKKEPAAETLKAEPRVAAAAAATIDQIRETLKGWTEYYKGFHPEFSFWLKQPTEDAQKSLEEYAKFLREEIAGVKGKDEDPLLGEPVGADGLIAELEAEMIPYSPTEVIAIGEREFNWCEARMKEAAREMGFGDDWKAAMAKVKSIHEPPGRQDEYVAAQAREALAFVSERGLVTIPKLCEETWRIRMLSPKDQREIPYAAYGGLQVNVAYAHEEMTHSNKLMSMRGNNRHFSRITTAHEVIPGHHLQAFYASRYREYRGTFFTPFFVEGWALYWEMKLWNLGYARGPEDRIGMLFWRMHRSARIIVTLKFHLGQMAPKEMVDFLVDRVGHERFGATSEVRRFLNVNPLYQCSYMIGALQLTALHDEVLAGKTMTEREFNDTVLQYGPIPVELIRAGVLKVPLTWETKSAWRFDDAQKK